MKPGPGSILEDNPRSWRSGRAVHTFGWLAASLLCACGGDPTPGIAPPAVVVRTDETAPSTAGSPAKEVAASSAKPAPGAVAPSRPAPAATANAPAAPEYMLMVFKDRALHRDEDELAPVRGAGYAPLRAFVYLRGKPRNQSPVASVQAYCLTPTRCEYIPPRKSGFAERYTISLDDATIARLSAANDMVVISTRELDVAKPVTVSLTLTIPGREPILRRIIYAKSAS